MNIEAYNVDSLRKLVRDSGHGGRIVTDDLPLEDAAKELFQLVLDVASGKKVKAEVAGFHDLAIFKQGVTL